MNAFLFDWVTTNPSIALDLPEEITPFVDKCLIAFIYGWAKYSLENNYSKDKLECTLTATKLTIEFYEKNKRAIKGVS